MSVVTDAPSIRRRLLALLLIPTAAIAAVATYYDYRTASTLFEAGYDRALLDAALAISSNIQARDGERPMLALTPDAVTMLRTDSLDQIYYRVSAGDGRFIAGDADLPVLHQRVGNPTFGHARYRGELIRIASYRVMTGGAASIVTVAETLHKRNAARQRVLQSSLAVDAAQLAAALLVIWLGVRLAIAPLRAVEQDLAGRRPRDLEAFSTAQVPVELRSLIEALNRLMEALAESQAAERSFLENAAHQLRTPLAGMLAQLELLAAPGAEISGARIQAALTSGRRLARTAQQLLALARSEAAARTATDLDRVWLPAAIETCVGVHLPAADAARLDLGAQVEAAEILGLPWLIEEALGNLVDNAIAATPPGGSVTLRCGTLEGHAFVEVCDTGVGIPAAERAQVFQRFYRASNARVPGSGLGLAIVHEVARMHGAKLELAAGDGERGMVVRMTFP